MIQAITTKEINSKTGPELTDVYNTLIKELPEADRPKTITKFATRDIAVNRVKNLVRELKKLNLMERDASEGEKPAKGPRRRRGTNRLPPGTPPTPCLLGSRQAAMLDLLARKEGATMDELLQGLSGGKHPWTEKNVRSGFGWDMKQHGYGVRSVIREGEPERFMIVVPTGYSIPPHRLNKTLLHAQKKAAAK